MSYFSCSYNFGIGQAFGVGKLRISGNIVLISLSLSLSASVSLFSFLSSLLFISLSLSLSSSHQIFSLLTLLLGIGNEIRTIEEGDE
jgi:hypothetical protein